MKKVLCTLFVLTMFFGSVFTVNIHADDDPVNENQINETEGQVGVPNEQGNAEENKEGNEEGNPVTLLSNPNQNNEGGTNNNNELQQISNVKILFNEKTINLSSNGDENYLMWFLDWNNTNKEYINDLINALHQEQDFNYTIQYKVGENTKNIDKKKSETLYGNYAGIHGFYYEYDENGAKGLICVGPTDSSTRYTQISSASFTNGNVTATFKKNDQASTDRVVIYELEGEFDSNVLKGENGSLKIKFVDGEGETPEIDYGFLWDMRYGNQDIIGANIFYSVNNDPNHMFLFVGKYVNPQDEIRENSFIDVYGDYDFDVNTFPDGTYQWIFYVDPIDAYRERSSQGSYFKEVKFINNGIFSNITFNQIIDDEYTYQVPQTKETVGEEELVKLTLKGDNESFFNIEGSEDGRNGTQTHLFQVTVKSDEILKHSFVSGINDGQKARVLDYKIYQYFNLDDSIFGNLKTDLIVSEDTSTLISAIENIDPGDSQKEMHLEDNYFSLALVEGASITNKSYSLSENGANKSPVVTYTISKGNVSETFEVRVITGGSHKEVVMIEGDVYLKKIISVAGIDYTVYVSEFADQNMEKTILEYLDYRYPVIVFNGGMEHRGNDLTYIDGLYIRKEYTKNLKVYYPKEGIEINNDTKYSDLGVVDALNKSIVISSNDGKGSYNNVKERLNDIKRIPVGYIDASGTSHYVEEDCRFYDYAQFESYSGNKVAYYAGLKQVENGEYTITEQIKTRNLISIVKYNKYYPEDRRRNDNVKTLYISQVNGSSNSEKLENAIKILQNSYDPLLIIDVEEFVLDKSVILNRFMLGDELNKKSFLKIDLKGNTIDLGNNRLEIPENCGLQLVNSADNKRGKITGSGEHLIKSYGRLNIKDNIDFENTNGTALVVANDSFGMDMEGAISINAATGIKWVERTFKYFKQMNNVQLNIAGNISATSRCIDVNLPSEHEGLSYSIRFLSDRTTNLSTSSGVGVYVNGDVVVHLEKAEVTAGTAFEVNGGTYNLVEFNATAENNIFLVHSDSSNARPVKINFNLEGYGNEFFVDAGKSLIKDTASSASQSKISKISFLSSQGILGYFTYQQNNIFINVPASIVEMNSGYYSDSSFLNYLNPAPGTQKITYSGNNQEHQGMEYTQIVRPQSETWVHNYADLKSALQSNDITVINVAQNFNCNNEDPIDFTVKTGKSLIMHGHEIYNVSLIAKVEEILKDEPNSGEFRIIEGSIINSNDNVPITIKGAKLRLHENVSISAENANAIILENGDISTQGEDSEFSIIGKGSTYGDPEKASGAIFVNVDTSKSGYYANISLNNATVIGINSPAITTDSNGTNSASVQAHIENSKITTQRGIHDTAVSNNADTIVAYVPAAISIKKSSEVTSGNTAIKLVENNKEGTPSVQISSSTVEGKNGVHLIPGSHLTIEGFETHIDASENAIEAYELSNIHMEDGYVSGKEIVKYLDPETEYRRQSIKGGYFSKFVEARSIAYNPSDDFKYVCLLVDDPSNHPYPYEVLKQFKNINVYQSVSLSIKRDVEVDLNQLENAISDSERAALEAEAEREGVGEVDIVLTVRPETSNGNDNVAPNLRNREYYDIHMNKNVGQNKNRVEEVSEYQLITISLAGLVGEENVHNYDKDKINVWHRHSNGNAKPMKKVSATDGLKMQEECFYITEENNQYYVNIVTKRFSLFVLGEEQGTDSVQEQNLKENVELTLNYKSTYSVGEKITEPAEATISEGRTISIDDVKVVYEGADKNTVYYSPTASNPTLTPPSEPGTYRVIWTIKEENESMSGSGQKVFTISNSVTELSDGLVLHTGDTINNVSETDNWTIGGETFNNANTPATLVRANIIKGLDGGPVIVTESADGPFYVLKTSDSKYALIDDALIATSSSDGIQLTKTGNNQYDVSVHSTSSAEIEVTLSPDTAQTINLGGYVKFTATVSNTEDNKVVWSVDSTNAALYSDEACETPVGTVATDVLEVYAKGMSVGNVTITATSNADSEKSASCEATVIDPAVEDVKTKINALPEATDVTLNDKTAIETARTAYSKLSDGQKAQISEDVYNKLLAAEKALDDLTKAAAVTALINALPDPDKVTLDDEENVDQVLDAYRNLTEDQKKLISEKAVEKLDNAKVAIGNLREGLFAVVEGDGNVWERNSSKNLRFVFKHNLTDKNTFSSFRNIYVEGNKVERVDENYEASAGSVIINLKPAYLNNLSMGKYTLTVEFAKGMTATAQFTVTKQSSGGGSSSDSSYKLPKTGVE